MLYSQIAYLKLPIFSVAIMKKKEVYPIL